jgi:hypothetical protein
MGDLSVPGAHFNEIVPRKSGLKGVVFGVVFAKQKGFRAMVGREHQ